MSTEAKKEVTQLVQDCVDAMKGILLPDSGCQIEAMSDDEFEERVKPIVAYHVAEAERDALERACAAECECCKRGHSILRINPHGVAIHDCCHTQSECRAWRIHALLTPEGSAGK